MAVHSVSLYLPVSVLTVKSCIYFYMLIWSSCYTSVTGQHRVIGSSQDVLAKVGDDVILPCHIEPPVDAVDMTVEWSRPDLKPKYVHVIQDGRDTTDKNPLYKRRTYLFQEELLHGNISLKLSRVQHTDEGTFQCSVPLLSRISSDIQLLVGSGSHPVISSNGPTDGGVSLSCDSGCWYPQPEMSWLDGDGTLLPAGPSVTDKPSPHCYDVQRNVTVRTAGLVTCRVHLPLFKHTLETQHYIPVSDISTEGGSSGSVIAGIITPIIMIGVILVAAGPGYLYWKKKHPEFNALMELSNQPMKYSDLITNDEEIRIVLVGITGAGKSASGNTILGPEAFESRFAAVSVTKTCHKASGVVAGRMVSVIDTPGLFDTRFSNTETIKEVKNCISCAAPGPHVFLYVIKLGRFTDKEKNDVEMIQVAFGEHSVKYTMILFTHGDELLEGQTIEETFLTANKLRDLISKYKDRYHVFDNESEAPSSQVTELLEKINKMVKENGGSHYTNQMFQEAARRQDAVSQFVDQHQDELIQRVKKVNHILDLLLTEGVITRERYGELVSEATSQKKMEKLYELLDSTRAKDVFYKGLEENEETHFKELRDRDGAERRRLLPE